MIFTFGYGNRRNHDQLIEYFKAHDIKYLIDVRIMPYGWSALWHKDQLDKLCKEHGLTYVSKKDLGNTSGKPVWVPLDKKKALKALKEVAAIKDIKDQNLILMCSELDPNRCHRKEVAQQLSNLINVGVEHLK